MSSTIHQSKLKKSPGDFSVFHLLFEGLVSNKMQCHVWDHTI